MVIVDCKSPRPFGWLFLFQMAYINVLYMVVPHYLLTGMILQEGNSRPYFEWIPNHHSQLKETFDYILISSGRGIGVGGVVPFRLTSYLVAKIGS